jgi:hypothetical protein
MEKRDIITIGVGFVIMTAGIVWLVSIVQRISCGS